MRKIPLKIIVSGIFLTLPFFNFSLAQIKPISSPEAITKKLLEADFFKRESLESFAFITEQMHKGIRTGPMVIIFKVLIDANSGQVKRVLKEDEVLELDPYSEVGVVLLGYDLDAGKIKYIEFTDKNGLPMKVSTKIMFNWLSVENIYNQKNREGLLSSVKRGDIDITEYNSIRKNIHQAQMADAKVSIESISKKINNLKKRRLLLISMGNTNQAIKENLKIIDADIEKLVSQRNGLQGNKADEFRMANQVKVDQVKEYLETMSEDPKIQSIINVFERFKIFNNSSKAPIIKETDDDVDDNILD